MRQGGHDAIGAYRRPAVGGHAEQRAPAASKKNAPDQAEAFTQFFN